MADLQDLMDGRTVKGYHRAVEWRVHLESGPVADDVDRLVDLNEQLLGKLDGREDLGGLVGFTTDQALGVVFCTERANAAQALGAAVWATWGVDTALGNLGLKTRVAKVTLEPAGD